MSADAIFLPGIIAPVAVRYAPLLEHLSDARVLLTELAIYAGDQPPRDYSIDTEVAAIGETAGRAGLRRFHLCAHSGGAACALAFAAAFPERLLSLAVDEPATDFTVEDHADPYWGEIAAARALPVPEAMTAFLRLQLSPGVELPPRPPGPPPPWMAKRAAGISVFPTAVERHRVDPSRYRAFGAPVLFTHGSLSHPRWMAMRDRLSGWFPDFRSVLFEGLHHLNTSHQAEPARTAALLRELWSRAA